MAQVTKWKGRTKRNRITRPGKYLWSDKERDPEMLFLIERTNEDPRSVNALAEQSYLSPGTLYSAIDGNTRRPQNRQIATMYPLLDLLYDKEVGDYRPGASDGLISSVCGVSASTIYKNRVTHYGTARNARSDKPHSDAQRLRMIEDKVDSMIDLLETLTKQK